MVEFFECFLVSQVECLPLHPMRAAACKGVFPSVSVTSIKMRPFVMLYPMAIVSLFDNAVNFVLTPDESSRHASCMMAAASCEVTMIDMVLSGVDAVSRLLHLEDELFGSRK